MDIKTIKENERNKAKDEKKKKRRKKKNLSYIRKHTHLHFPEKTEKSTAIMLPENNENALEKKKNSQGVTLGK